MIEIPLLKNDQPKPEELGTSQPPNAPNDPLSHFLVQVDDPWYVSLRQQVREFLHPPKLPPLEVTSEPAQVKDIWGEYRYGRVSSLSSMLVHLIVLSILLVPFGHKVVQVVKKEVLFIPLDISPYQAQLPPSNKKAGGGGGGGDRSPQPASFGKLPRFSLRQLTPPEVVIRNPDPKLPEEPTVIVPPDIKLPMPNIAVLGDPLGKLGPPSNGPGFGGGIGSGSGGGVGSGQGAGVGPGQGGGIGGGVFRVGGGVSAPRLVFKKEPEYSEQARKAKFQGTVVLNIVVQRDGSVRDIRVVQPLGLGLDEKAVEAVKEWRFQPGVKNGVPVDVAATIEVTFRLL